MGNKSSNARFYGNGSAAPDGCTCAALASGCKCNCNKCAMGKHCYCQSYCQRRNLTESQMRLWKVGQNVANGPRTWQGPVFNAVEFDQRLTNSTPSLFVSTERPELLDSESKNRCSQCERGCDNQCPCPCHRHISDKPIIASMYGMNVLGYNGDRVSACGMEGFSAGKKCVCGKTPCVCQPNNYQPTPLMANMWGME